MAILTYHHIGECPPEQQDHPGLFVSQELFRSQLAWLKSHGYKSVSLDDLAASISGGPQLPRRWIVITFDDGFRNNYTAAYPLLKEFGYSAVIFLITDRVARAEPADRWDDYLTQSDLDEMLSGGIEFGSHTHTHPRLTKLESEAVIAELAESTRRMKHGLGLDPHWFCYPYGNLSPRIAALVKEAGFRGAVSTIRDNRPAPGQLYWLPRVMVMNDTLPERLAYMLSPWYHYVHAWKNRKRWKSIR